MKNGEERREQVIRILMANEKCTMQDLAQRLGVSVRTIERDVDFLSLTKPIQVDRGRAGGVYIMNRKGIYLPMMREEEVALLKKIISDTEQNGACRLTLEDIHMLKTMICQYSIYEFDLKKS